jgi:iron-sulfur cluster repair protein YtfE (RIC family)
VNEEDPVTTTILFPDRLDLFTTIHRGLRVLLFDVARAAARIDAARDDEVDALVSQVERLLEYLDEHAGNEDRHILPALRTVAPELEAFFAADHRRLDALQRRVGAAAGALELAAPADRAAAAAALARGLNELVAAHLAHMHREETDANAALWGRLADEELLAIQGRIVGGIPPERRAEWMELVLPAVSPAERRRLAP